MNKKLLTTSALAGVVALAGSAFAETKVGGNLEYVFNAASATTSLASASGSGFEENIKISNSKDTDFGTFSYGFNLENAATEGAHMQLVAGDTTIQIGADSFANLSQTVVPNTGESYQTVAGGIGDLHYEIAFDMGAGDTNAGVARKNSVGLGIAQKVAGGTVALRYAPNSAQGNSNTAGGSAQSGTSSMMAQYKGSLGVEGLTVMLGYAKDEAYNDNKADGKAKTFGAAYTMGALTVGAQRKVYEDVNTVAAQSEYKANEYGIGYVVNDNLTLSINHIVTDGDSGGTALANKEKITGIGIGYNLGGIALELTYADVSDVAGVAGSDGEAFQLKTVQAF
jgi:hypothetical protein